MAEENEHEHDHLHVRMQEVAAEMFEDGSFMFAFDTGDVKMKISVDLHRMDVVDQLALIGSQLGVICTQALIHVLVRNKDSMRVAQDLIAEHFAENVMLSDMLLKLHTAQTVEDLLGEDGKE